MTKLAKKSKQNLESRTLFVIENSKLVEKEVYRGKRCDMHCHDKYNFNPDGSIMYLATPLTKGTGFGIGVRESYIEPEEIYQVAKARGMDFVTISSHNSIIGAMELAARHRDAFVSCEYDVNGSETGHVIHVLVAGHEYIGRHPFGVHEDLLEAAKKGHEYFASTCKDLGLFYGLAHPAWISSPKIEMKPEYFHSWLETFDNWEINGSIQIENKLTKRALEIFLEDRKKKHLFAGSDCHHLNHVGMTFTETLESKIKTPRQFLEVLKNGEVGIGSYLNGDFDSQFYGSVKMLLKDSFKGIGHYITRENHARRRVLLSSSILVFPAMLLGLAIASIPYVITYREMVSTELSTKKLATDYFDYLESLDMEPLEEEIEEILKEKKEIHKRYKEAKKAIRNKSLVGTPSGWAKFVIKLLGKFNIFKSRF